MIASIDFPQSKKSLIATDQPIIIARKSYFSCGFFQKGQKPPGAGSNFELESFFQGKLNTKTGLVVNLIDIDPHLRAATSLLDHKHLNYEVPYFSKTEPLMGNIAHFLFEDIKKRTSHLNAKLVGVRLSDGQGDWVDVSVASLQMSSKASESPIR